MNLEHGVASVPPPSEAHFWIEMAHGHFVHYRDMMRAIDDMNRRRQQFAQAEGVEWLNVGETLDLFAVM
jgi:hypothetical protein